MAGKRRSGGFRPPELRGTLGTLLRTALQQAGGVRDALERGAREGRSRLDNFRADRQRTDALAELGELVLELIRAGEIDLKDELWGEVFEPLKDPAVFKRFRVDRETNTIAWETGADLAPEYLYERVARAAVSAGGAGRG